MRRCTPQDRLWTQERNSKPSFPAATSPKGQNERRTAPDLAAVKGGESPKDAAVYAAGSSMDARTKLKAKLPSRHVTEGPERAPHRSRSGGGEGGRNPEGCGRVRRRIVYGRKNETQSQASQPPRHRRARTSAARLPIWRR